MSKKVNPTWTLLALAISAFAIGSTEFISVGLMPLLVSHFHIDLAQAGLTVSIYALGIMIGAPVMTLLTGRLNRHKLMMLIMGLFIVGNLLAALAPTFGILLVGRVVAALAHGIFMTVASVIAADVVAPEKRASAIAVMFTGLTVATVTGVPLGTMIGQLGGWRWSFIFISAIGVIGLIADYWLVPRNLPLPAKATARGIIRVLTNPQLLLALLVTALGYGGTFVAYTYLSPLLEQAMGWSASAVVIILVVYGLMVALGNTLGGRWANTKPLVALFKMFVGLFITLLVLTVTAHSHWLGLFTVLAMGIFAFMNVPGLQLYIVQLAEVHTPQDVTMASALNISAFNVGIALGSGIGGQVTTQFGLTWTPLFGALMVAVSLVLLLGLIWLAKPARKLDQADCDD
ncbi:MFS transporter [Lactiplantibacillus songbeiensis]|uniref:MFS transporter n=1 Tax=Lactiplantibacillus songbeiensis TaxID=2559920 RepID=A0ABW4BY95_9LACO|nr:MFS transporter [Lactiplantibacillus songbeiensis]